MRSRLDIPETIRDVLGRALRRSKLDSKFKQFEFKRHWDEAVGPAVAAHSRPERFSGNSLVVKVDSSLWAQELSFHKKSILKRLQRFLNTEKVLTDIQFLVEGKSQKTKEQQ